MGTGSGGSTTDGGDAKRRAGEVKVKLSGKIGADANSSSSSSSSGKKDGARSSKSESDSKRKKSKSKSKEYDSEKSDTFSASDFNKPVLQGKAEHPFWADVDGHLKEPVPAQEEQLIAVGQKIAYLSPQLRYGAIPPAFVWVQNAGPDGGLLRWPSPGGVRQHHQCSPLGSVASYIPR